MNWKDLLIQIYVPGRDGGGTVGTGYPIGPDLVLTARHVVAKHDADEPIEVCWYQHPAPEASALRPITEVAWQGDDLDAAVIRVPFPAAAPGWGIPTQRQPDATMNWESEGFAAAGRRGQRSEPVAMKGGAHAAASISSTFDLDVSTAPPQAEQWKGASGAPVFVERRILGVITEAATVFPGTRLKAVPAWKLLENEDVRRLLGSDAREERLDELRGELELVLGESRTVRQELSRAFDVGVAPNAEVGAPTLAEALLQQSVEAALAQLVELQNNLLRLSRPDALVVRRLANALIPAIFDHPLVDGVATRLGHADSGLLTVPVATATVAEFVMAGAAGRGLQVHQRPGRDLPVGTLLIDAPPERGMDVANALHAFHIQMIKQFTPREFMAEEADWEADRDKMHRLVQHASDQLKYLCSQRRERHYLLFAPKTEDERVWCEALARGIREHYSALAVLELATDHQMRRSEAKLARFLRDLVSRDEPRA